MSVLNFQKIRLEDRVDIERLLQQSPYGQINCSFDVFYIWRDVGNVYFAIQDDFLFIQGRDPDGSCWYFFPFGKGDIMHALTLIWKDYLSHREQRAENEKLTAHDLQALPCYFRIVGTRKDQYEQIDRAAFEQAFGFTLMAAPQRDLDEYVYWADQFRGYKGKALQSKRNFVNYARKNFAPSYEPIHPKNLEECKTFSMAFGSADVGLDSDTFIQDQAALMAALDEYSKLNLYGGVIRVEGRIEALFIGTPLSEFNTVAGLFMRVNHSFKGLAPLLFEEFLSLNSDYSYINLDSDVGQLGIRKNKLSYLPDHLINIYELRTHYANWRHYSSIHELPEQLWETTVGKGRIWQDASLYRISEQMGAEMHYFVKKVKENIQAVCAFVRTESGLNTGTWETCDSAHWFDPKQLSEVDFKLEIEYTVKAYTDSTTVICWEDALPSSYLVLPPPHPSKDIPELLDVYISGLKSKYRNEMRKYLEAYRAHQLQWSLVEDYLPLMDEFYPLYLETVSRAEEFQTEAYPETYFTLAKNELGKHAKMLCLRDNQHALIGFMLLYFKDHTCVMQYTGSHRIRAYYPWHLMTMFSIAYAWSKKIRVIHLGITHFEGKKQFGAIASLPKA